MLPGLAVILVGEDPASQVYVRNKHRACTKVGMYSEVLKLSAETTEEELFMHIDRYNADPCINGLLVQFPVPGHLSQQRIIERILPEKDVDGLSLENAGKLVCRRQRTGILYPERDYRTDQADRY